jgi:hypothetical protein
MTAFGMTALGESSKSRPRNSRPVRVRRYEPVPMYVLAEQLKARGVELHRSRGPWRPLQRPLRRPGRNAEMAIPIVTNGRVEIAVDTAEHAVDLSGLLNSVGVDHLNPAPSLRPPAEDLANS